MNPQDTSRKILILQSHTERTHTPYKTFAQKHGFTIDFHPCASVKPVAVAKFRSYTKDLTHKDLSLIFTSKIAIDHFFRLIKDIRVKLPEDIYYFCATEQLKNYLQKYTKIRHRKVSYGTKGIEDVFPKIKQKNNCHFFFPCSNTKQKSFAPFFKKENIFYKEIPTYQTDFHDLKGLSENRYQVILFFSPLEVKALASQVPHLVNPSTRIGAFGKATAKMLADLGWDSHIHAPRMQAPSLVDALHLYFSQNEG